MRNAICAAVVLSSVAACSTPAEPSNPGASGMPGVVGSATGGSGGTGGTGGSSGAPAAGTTAMGSGGLSTGTGGMPATGGSTGGVATTGGAAGTSVSGSAGTVASTGGAGGDTMSAGGMSGATASGGLGGAAGSAGASGGAAGTPGGGFATCPYTGPADSAMANYVAGDLITFNNNGAWTWYCDERAVVDAAGGKIIVGGDANAQGDGGSGRDGNVDAVIYDVATKTVGAVKALGDLGPDDHNTAAFLVKPDGKYLAAWAGHNENCNTYWSNHDGSTWAAQKTFAWGSLGCPTESGRSVTYNNLWNMTAESKIYNFVRSVDTSPNILVSSDSGATWTYGGRLTSTPTVGYVAGYYKYWGNQVDRIDFFGTEAHPRDFDNNLYHGYIKGGKSYDSKDVEKDGNLSDSMQPQVTAFTKVVATGAMIGDVRVNHLWNSDLMRYDDGTIVALGMGRIDNNTDTPDHRFIYSRWNGTEWKNTNIGKTGVKLYDSEQDYTGLASAHPDDPNIIYLSTPFDPRNPSSTAKKREIWMGVTCDQGATFTWTPITWNSTMDNIRPIVPKWDKNNMVLLWNRGTYSTAQIYNMDIVGIVTQK